MKYIIMTTALTLTGNASLANEIYCYNSEMNSISVECINSNQLHFKAALQTYKTIKNKPTPISLSVENIDDKKDKTNSLFQNVFKFIMGKKLQ